MPQRQALAEKHCSAIRIDRFRKTPRMVPAKGCPWKGGPRPGQTRETGQEQPEHAEICGHVSESCGLWHTLFRARRQHLVRDQLRGSSTGKRCTLPAGKKGFLSEMAILLLCCEGAIMAKIFMGGKALRPFLEPPPPACPGYSQGQVGKRPKKIKNIRNLPCVHLVHESTRAWFQVSSIVQTSPVPLSCTSAAGFPQPSCRPHPAQPQKNFSGP